MEMLPEAKVFLDVDDLEEIGDLERYVKASDAVLVFCSDGYCASKNCLREIRHAVAMGRPLIPLLEEAGRGGIDAVALRAQLEAADGKYEQWGFDEGEPRGAQLAAALFDHVEPIEWNRLGEFQDVTMRLIAQRLLPDNFGKTSVRGEITVDVDTSDLHPDAVKLADKEFMTGAQQAQAGLFARMWSNALVLFGTEANTTAGGEAMVNSHRVYVSRHNEGADKLAKEAGLAATRELGELERCTHFLLYLDGRTWTSGERSEALGCEVEGAVKAGVPVVLAHEMPGVGQTCDAVPFDSFFACADGATPTYLLKAGLYKRIAVPLKAGPWRDVGLVLLHKELKKTHEASRSQPPPATIMKRIHTNPNVTQDQPPPLKKRIGGSSRRALVDPNPKPSEDSASHFSRHVIQSRAGLSNFGHLIESPPTDDQTITGQATGKVAAVERARAANSKARKLGALQNWGQRIFRRSVRAERQSGYLSERPSVKLCINDADSNTSEGKGENFGGMMSSSLMTAQV